MFKQKNRIYLTVLLLIALISVTFGFFVSQYMHQSPKMDVAKFHGTWLENPREVSSFEFNGTNQKPFNNKSLANHWTMMFFGFTKCPTICPVTMAELGKMYQLLSEKGVNQMPQVVMVSLDPERDSIDVLDKFVKAFNPDFLGAKADSEEGVKVLTQEMGVAFTKVTPSALGDEKQAYSIEHTGTVMLFNPKGQLCAFFTMPHQASNLAEDYIRASRT